MMGQLGGSTACRISNESSSADITLRRRAAERRPCSDGGESLGNNTGPGGPQLLINLFLFSAQDPNTGNFGLVSSHLKTAHPAGEVSKRPAATYASSPRKRASRLQRLATACDSPMRCCLHRTVTCTWRGGKRCPMACDGRCGGGIWQPWAGTSRDPG